MATQFTVSIDHILNYAYINYFYKQLLRYHFTNLFLTYFKQWYQITITDFIDPYPQVVKVLSAIDVAFDKYILIDVVDRFINFINNLHLASFYPWNVARSGINFTRKRVVSPVIRPFNNTLLSNLNRYLPTSTDKLNKETLFVASDDELTKSRKLVREFTLRLQTLLTSRARSVQSIYSESLKSQAEASGSNTPTINSYIIASFITLQKVASAINKEYITPLHFRTSNQIIDLVTTTKNNVDHYIEEARNLTANGEATVNGIKENGVDVLNTSNNSSNVPVQAAA